MITLLGVASPSINLCIQSKGDQFSPCLGRLHVNLDSYHLPCTLGYCIRNVTQCWNIAVFWITIEECLIINNNRNNTSTVSVQFLTLFI